MRREVNQLTKTRSLISALILVVVFSLVIAIGGASVAQAAIVVNTVSPVGACPGETVTVTGTAVPGETVTVIIALERVTNWDGGSALPNDDRYEVILGSAQAGVGGGWSLSAAIPTTVVRTSDYTQVDTPAGDWMITTQSSIDGTRTSQGQFVTVLDCGQETTATTTTTTTTVSGGTTTTTMPKTGFPMAITSIFGGLLTSAGIGIRVIRRGR